VVRISDVAGVAADGGGGSAYCSMTTPDRIALPSGTGLAAGTHRHADTGV